MMHLTHGYHHSHLIFSNNLITEVKIVKVQRINSLRKMKLATHKTQRRCLALQPVSKKKETAIQRLIILFNRPFKPTNESIKKERKKKSTFKQHTLQDTSPVFIENIHSCSKCSDTRKQKAICFQNIIWCLDLNISSFKM